MPRAKEAKNNPSLPVMRKKKINKPATPIRKRENKSNVSTQRPRKSKTVKNQSVDVTPSRSAREGNEEGEADSFFLSPAYLCECSLQTQDSSGTIAVETLNSGNSKIKTNPVEKKKIQQKTKKSESKKNNCDQSLNPAYLCESILSSKDTKVAKINPKTNYSKITLTLCHPGKRNDLRQNSKELKKNATDYSQELNPAYLCESVLQTGNTPVSVDSSVNRYKSTLLESNPLKKRNLLRKREEVKKSYLSNNDQEFNPLYLCESVIQSEDTSVTSESSNYKSGFALNESISVKRNKLGHSSKNPKNNNNKLKNSVDIRSINQLGNCSVFFKPGSTIQNGLKNGSLQIKPLKNKKLKGTTNNEVENQCVEFIPKPQSKNTLQTKFAAVVTDHNLSKNSCPKPGQFSNPLGKMNLRSNRRKKNNRNDNKHFEEYTSMHLNEVLMHPKEILDNSVKLNHSQVKEKKLQIGSLDPNSNRITNKQQKVHNSLVFSKSNPMKKDFSVSLLENNQSNGNKLRQNKIGIKIVKVNNHKQTLSCAQPSESKLISVNTSFNLELYSKTKESSKTLQHKPAIKETPRRNSKKSKCNQVQNRRVKNNPKYQYTSTSQSESPKVVLDSNLSKVNSSQSSLLKRSPLSQKNLRNKNNKTEKYKDVNNIGEFNYTSHCESLIKVEPTSVQSESESDSFSTELHHYSDVDHDSDVDLEIKEENNHKTIEEISYIECNLLQHDSEHRGTSECIQDDVIHHELNAVIDPLGFQSTEVDQIACDQKEVDTKECNPDDERAVDIYSTKVDVGECHLHLECSLEDQELDSNVGSCGSNDGECDVSPTDFNELKKDCLERFSFSNLELECDSGTLAQYPCYLKLTFETDDNVETGTPPVENKQSEMSETYIVPEDRKNMKMSEDKINCSQVGNNVVDALRGKDSDELTIKENNNSLQSVKLVPNLSSTKQMNDLQEEIREGELVFQHKDKPDVTDVLENRSSKEESQENLSSEMLAPPPKSVITEHSSAGADSVDCESHSSRSEISPTETKNMSYCEDNEKDKTDDKENIAVDELGRNCNESDNRFFLEMSQTTNIQGFKEKPSFHEERVLKVLLRRLEDEDIFKLWKKDGVISQRQFSQSKETLTRIQISSLSGIIQKPLRKRKNYKCFACKKCFKNRERYLEHRKSKCDTERVFECDNCNRKYILRKMLVEHRTKCISAKHFSCKICWRKFDTPERLDEHTASKCDTQKVFNCDVCGRSFIFMRLLLIHKTPICTSLRRYKCSVCQQSFHKDDLKSHKLKEHRIGIDPIDLCEFCGKLVTRKHLPDHMSSHLDILYYTCRLCKQKFRTKDARRWHEQSHYDCESCVCADCGKTFQRLVDLEKHLAGHGNDNKCQFCGKVILNQNCYRAHVKRHFKTEGQEETDKFDIKQENCDEDNSQSTVEEKPFKCSECEEIFSERPAMEQHLLTVHQTDMFIKSEEKTDMYQNSCLDQNKPFKCELCTNSYTRRPVLNEHKRKVHGVVDEPFFEDKPFKCEICGNSFFKKEHLRRHRKRMHGVINEAVKTPTEEKTHSCHICGTCYGKRRSLMSHIRRVHSGNRFFPCSFCTETFQTNDLLKAHTFEHFKDCFETNTGIENLSTKTEGRTLIEEKPYVCDICGKCFGEKRNLNRHRNRIHNEKLVHPGTSSTVGADVGIQTENHMGNFSENKNVKEEEKVVTDPEIKVETMFSSSYVEKPVKEFKNISIVKEENNFNHVHNQNSRVHTCEECGKKYSTVFSQERHVCPHKLDTFQRTFGRDVHACDECGVFFFEKCKLNRHLVTHSTQVFKCEVCKKSFTTQRKLSVHLLVHGIKTVSEHSFKCLTCHKLFPTSEQLEIHSVLHTERHTNQCTKCAKTFTTPFSLKRHYENTHAEKCFSCNYCQMSFFSFSSLNQHVMYVHKKSVSLTEYVLKIDDEVDEETPLDASYSYIENLQSGGTGEINLQPQVFASIGNMFMNSKLFNETPLQLEKPSGSREQMVRSNDIICDLTAREKQAGRPLEVTVRIEDW